MDNFHFNTNDMVRLLSVSENVEKGILNSLKESGYNSVSSIDLMKIMALCAAHFIAAFESKSGDIIKLRTKFNGLVREAYEFWKKDDSNELASLLKTNIGDA